MDTDRALFDRLRTTDHEAAITELFDRYTKLVYSVAFKVLRDEGAAEDVTQDLFIGIWRTPPVMSSQSESLTRWFMVAARNRAISTLRARKPEDPIDQANLITSHKAQEQMESNFAIGQVRQVMETLTAEQKATLESAFFDGLTHKEIAAKTGHALGTVKTRIRTSLKVVAATCRLAAKPAQGWTVREAAEGVAI